MQHLLTCLSRRSEIRDHGLLKSPMGPGLAYTDSTGRRHYGFHLPRRVRRKVGALACMVDCDDDEGDVLYGKGWNGTKYKGIGMGAAEKIMWPGISGGVKKAGELDEEWIDEWKRAAQRMQLPTQYGKEKEGGGEAKEGKEEEEGTGVRTDLPKLVSALKQEDAEARDDELDRLKVNPLPRHPPLAAQVWLENFTNLTG